MAALPELRDGACGVSGVSYDIGYPDPDSSDTDGSCIGDFGSFSGTANLAISQITDLDDSCNTIRTYLLNDADIFEWTGWVEDDYWWDAGTWGIGGAPRIGFHYDEMDDAGLWAHEGAHAVFSADETLANFFQNTCVLF